ncbi:MAG: glycosyltransferase family 87 protein [Gemmataceae bacterium]
MAIFVRKGDFMCHRGVGQAFLAGNPYECGQDIYPVARTMMITVFAFGSLYFARTLSYVLAIIALLVCFFCWKSIANGEKKVSSKISQVAALFTVVLSCAFLIRDLDECGLQLFTLFFLSAGGYSLYHGKKLWSGFWLATAAMWKVTPIVFLPFLLWKREWKAAGWMGGFLLAWCVAPMPFVGVEMTVKCHQQWLARSIKIASAKQAYPSQLELEAPKVYNLSLHATIARNLETYPPSHPLHLDHPAFFQFGNLPPLTAYYAVRGVLLVLGLILAWRFWGNWSQSNGSPRFAHEWAAVCILSAILSPVTWKQHLVLMLPALFLIFRNFLSEPSVAPWRRVSLLIVALIFLIRRELIGKPLALVLLAYKVDTFAVLLLMLLILTPSRKSQSQDEPKLLAYRQTIPPDTFPDDWAKRSTTVSFLRESGDNRLGLHTRDFER